MTKIKILSISVHCFINWGGGGGAGVTILILVLYNFYVFASLSCRDDSGFVSCNLQVNYYSAGYNQLGLLLEDWLPNANLPSGSRIVLLGVKNDNGMLNRPLPSCLLPQFQNESSCEPIQMKMTLICMKWT